jgi:hypothetical protein
VGDWAILRAMAAPIPATAAVRDTAIKTIVRIFSPPYQAKLLKQGWLLLPTLVNHIKTYPLSYLL